MRDLDVKVFISQIKNNNFVTAGIKINNLQ